MIKAYVNYPNPHITAHRSASCGAVQQMKKVDQRYVRIDVPSISRELQRFIDTEHKFAANPGANDMWIELDFGEVEFEVAVLGYVHRLMARHYSPFARVVINTHCQ